MGILDYLCFCRGDKHEEEPSNEPLLAAPSIASQEGYGAVNMSTGGKEDTNSAGLSTSARKRIDQIGREVGNQMLPISQSRIRGPSHRAPSPSGSASEPSRPPTPSPRRPAPGNGVLSPPDEDEDADASSGEGGSTAATDGVVHKSLFPGGAGSRGGGGGNGGKKRGAKGGRGRGRGRGKKTK